ncbi:carboxypeptidase regulatory-like domain-containing protein [Planctomyces sp. SH-PL62]|uniref:carboxypeptidase regulatory-like domain-containing protein n=1 Tax=Planctomyces sp. SH-PL62 TaxID=1636152 RepID=UPI0012E8D660|nr:carboxypeptidase regulatory-like domain-containing protein [Planctomyces sp. SH-PL62]
MGLLTPPILVLAGAAATIVWPQAVVGVMDRVVGPWTPPSESALVNHRPPPMIRTPMPAPPPPITGTIRKPDGSPLDRDFKLLAIQVSTGGSHSQSWTPDRPPRFSAPLQGERNWIVVEAEGYAPKVVGPIAPRPAGTEGEELSITLEAGYPHRIRVVDAEGSPIPRAEVHAGLTIEDQPARLASTYLTDPDGWAVIPNVKQADYEFDVKVHQFKISDDTIFARPQPGVDTTITLDRGSTSGVAVDEDGRPVADALVLISAEFDTASQMHHMHPFQRLIVATSDAEGRFPIPHLHKDSVYLIRVEGPDGSAGHAPGVRLKGPKVRVTLHPRRLVRGIVRRNPGAPMPLVSVLTSIPTGFEGHGSRAEALVARERLTGLHLDADGRFEYPVWDPEEARLEVGGRLVPIPWPPPTEPIPIGPASAAEWDEQNVTIRLTGDETARKASGSMTLYLTNGRPERALQAVPRLVEIQEGRGSFSALASDAFRYDSSAMPGWWTAPGTIPGMSPIGGDRMTNVRIFPSGSISGRVVDADGRPVGEGTTVRPEFDPSWLASNPPSDWANQPTPGLTTDAQGRFTIPAWPLNVTCRLSVERGKFVVLADPVRPDAGVPRPEVEIRVPRLASAQARILDPDGRPIPDAAVALTLNPSAADARRWPDGRTDADGLIRFDDLAEGEDHYVLTVSFPRDFRPLTVPIKPGAPPLEVRAERGRSLEIRVVEAVTGWPVPGVQLYAQGPDGLIVQADAPTDDDGRYHFSTLPQGEIRLTNAHLLTWESPQPPIVAAGESGPILIRVTQLHESGPRPRPPARP